MLIVIEGCVGAGKTTVATGLAACRGSTLLLEDFEANPYLHAFYQDPERYATKTEFAFLLLHFHQLKSYGEAAQTSEIISDFHLGKDLLYADLNLKDVGARALFGNLYELCCEMTPSPSLIVFLSATTDLLLDRIRRRNREFELKIDAGYYKMLNAAYEEFFERYPGRKLRLPMDEWDFVKAPSLYGRLASLVDGELNTR